MSRPLPPIDHHRFNLARAARRSPAVSYIRPSFDRYCLNLAREAATRATCPRLRVGAVLVLRRCVISTGYNGAPAGEPHCDDVGCQLGESGGCVRTVHAEHNAINNATFSMPHGYTMYTTHSPCAACLELLANFGIRRVVFAEAYRISNAALAAELGVRWEHLPA